MFLSVFSLRVSTRVIVALTIASGGASAEVPESALMSVALLHRTQTKPTREKRPAAINHLHTGIYQETACVTSEIDQLSRTHPLEGPFTLTFNISMNLNRTHTHKHTHALPLSFVKIFIDFNRHILSISPEP